VLLVRTAEKGSQSLVVRVREGLSTFVTASLNDGQSAAGVVNWLTGMAGQGQHLDIDPQTGVPTDSNASGMATAAGILLEAYKLQGASLMYQFAQAKWSEFPFNIFR
jgi:hypothetical protein